LRDPFPGDARQGIEAGLAHPAGIEQAAARRNTGGTCAACTRRCCGRMRRALLVFVDAMNAGHPAAAAGQLRHPATWPMPRQCGTYEARDRGTGDRGRGAAAGGASGAASA
jgi:hypothetical protein